MKILFVPIVALISISTAASQNPAPSKTTELTGEVRLINGEPMKKGRILFYNHKGQITGCVIRDGKYKVEKPNVGEQIVTIDGEGIATAYGDPEKSGLVFNVIQDINNRIDLELKSK